MKFQLMPPRGGNRFKYGRKEERGRVSTHAPARGQSEELLKGLDDYFSFNSCPREGAINIEIKKFFGQACFNSCPREGAIRQKGRRRWKKFLFQLMPPRGGNHRQDRFKVLAGAGFNSCPREGAIREN